MTLPQLCVLQAVYFNAIGDANLQRQTMQTDNFYNGGSKRVKNNILHKYNYKFSFYSGKPFDIDINKIVLD